MELTATNVRNTLLDCLFKSGEDRSSAVEVKGIMSTFNFDPVKLEAKKADIKSMLEELPNQFQEKGGGGWSFLNAFETKRGIHWGEHPDIEKLLVLGLATKLVSIPIPREYWHVLPGGLPYFVVRNTEE